MNKFTIILPIILLLLFSGCATTRSYGRFVGSPKVELLDDGRKIRLLESFVYIDPKNLEWIAPAGWVVDGASIPQVAWPIIGGPLEGKYRNASVIHDVACDQKLRSWKAVHEVFYYSMLCSGVNKIKARIMYAAVYHFGPRWDVKVDVKGITGSEAQNALEIIRFESAPGSIIKIIKPLVFPDKLEKLDMTVLVIPPKNQLLETDFNKLKTLIEDREYSKKGPMSLEEIRNYLPSK